jgi:hypothetical protein
MTRELTIYCDESDISGKFFSNFYGGALVESQHQQTIIDRLERKKLELNLGAELKWQKISEAYAEKYIAFLDEVFDIIANGQLKIRVMFTQNYFGAARLTPAQRENGFFLLYYQFLKHAFGLQFAGNPAVTPPTQTRVRVYFDKLPDTHEKCSAFKGFVLGLNQNKHFKAAGIVLKEDQIAEVDSKHHVIMQSLDIIMGAIQFRLNEKHREIPEGAKRRGKRTIAKERVYKHVLKRIREIYPRFNIGVNTGIANDQTNLWQHPYRHWLFKPTDMEIRPEYAKHK